MKGDVRICIETWMPERLLQRAADMGIRLLRVERAGGHRIVVEAGAKDAERLTSLCERFSIPCRVLARRGRSALMRFARARWTLLPGIAVAVALCWLMLGRIWRIDIAFTGSAAGRGDPAAFARALGDMGIRPGVSREIDSDLLSGELLAGAPDYSFVAARVEGVRLLVEAAPEVPAPEVYDVLAARDLCADRNGVVVSVNVESGVACVQPGDTVMRGQLLIRGEERSSGEATRGICALGEVVVRAWYEGSAEGSLRASQLVYTGRSSTSSQLRTPWLSIPVVGGESFALQAVETEIIPIGGLYVPVSIVRETRRETRWQREEGDRELLSSRLADLAMADARTALHRSATDDCRIARSWIRFSLPDTDTLRADAVYEIYTNTAVAREELPKGG